ncbi:GTPase [Achromobacter pestifer]|uniref:GTPase n=1 Tax=Achromobacter pestifer TaxID=1353889 RepID=A0A6S6Z322_9BURK|nr:GTPase [Achromobacter pestifer]CAB3648251.1 hypothetical protein LMG3431_02642 [Achromobacter pestifer]
MDIKTINELMPALAKRHLPTNVYSYQCAIYNGRPQYPWLHFDPHPFKGRVIAKTDEAIIVKTGRANFAALDRTLVTDVPDEGDRVHVEPYARRRFDGQRADTPEEPTGFTADGLPHAVNILLLRTCAPAKLPIPQAHCPYLQDLINRLEHQAAPDGVRSLTHLLVDACAGEFAWIDPPPKDIIRTPPSISFSVSTRKFQGRVTVLWHVGSLSYEFQLHRDGELIKRVDDVSPADLGKTLERLIDDGQWRRIRVQRLPRRGPLRR